MHLIFIRHGDPDYEHNTITQKGRREAELLSRRILTWNVDEFYCSPYGRAQDTLKPALEKLRRSCVTLDWLREFDVPVTEPSTGEERPVFWDIMPRNYFSEKKYFSLDSWCRSKLAKSGNVQKRYDQVCKGIDDILESYDYSRFSKSVPVYNCFPHLTKDEALVDTHLDVFQKDLDSKNLVFVCHLGVMFAIISHLTAISPVQLWQSFFVAPSSVTVLGAEERVPGEVIWRVQSMGDVRHLVQNGESSSASGFFGNVTDF